MRHLLLGLMEARPSNYFDFFELEHKLDVDLDDLEKRFYTLSRQLHPDRFARSSAEERQQSLDATAILNDAYRTLRDPIARAEYLLKEQGFATGDPPQDLLEEVFELNMALEEMDQEQIDRSRAKFTAMRDEIDRDLHSKFTQNNLAEIRALLNRRKYITNLVSKAEVGQAVPPAQS